MPDPMKDRPTLEQQEAIYELCCVFNPGFLRFMANSLSILLDGQSPKYIGDHAYGKLKAAADGMRWMAIQATKKENERKYDA